jgi:hypothetical protein
MAFFGILNIAGKIKFSKFNVYAEYFPLCFLIVYESILKIRIKICLLQMSV